MGRSLGDAQDGLLPTFLGNLDDESVLRQTQSRRVRASKDHESLECMNGYRRRTDRDEDV